MMKTRPIAAFAALLCGASLLAAASTTFAAGAQQSAGQAAPPQPPPATAPAPARGDTPAPAPAPTAAPAAAGTTAKATAPVVPAGVATPPGYVIGPEDVLTVIVWRENDMSVDATTVRPDGMITVPVINDVAAAGLTPQQLRERITEVAAKYVTDPNITVVVKAINSRNVYITGQVLKPGRYPLAAASTVLQLIATAGGLAEYANGESIRIVRIENGRTSSLRFNYQDVAQGKQLEQNIELKPGDTIVVP